MNAFRLFIGMVYGVPFCVVLAHWLTNAARLVH